jgi:hypothetical protein
MHWLRQKADEIPAVGEFVEAAMQNPICQGVIVDLNPIWLAGWRAHSAGLPATGTNNLPGDPVMAALGVTPAGDPGIDIGWTDASVGSRIREVFGTRTIEHQALLLKAIAIPGLPEEKSLGLRMELVKTITRSPFASVIETRPPATLAFSCGDPCSVAGGQSGTIGGFLRDQKTQKVYAATCGHVVPTQDEKVLVGGTAIGRSSYTRHPEPLTAIERCSPKHSRYQLDLALIDIGAAPVVNTAKRVAQSLYPTELVRVTGAVSRTSMYEVGGAGLSYLVGGACFTGLVELKPPTSVGAAAWLRQIAAPVLQQGDSGAWVERTISQEWCGVLIGIESGRGYALEASDVVAAANRQFDMNLVPV